MIGRILLAEDNAANRKVALAMLSKLGYAADAVANGREAVEAAAGGAYDAVLMDCRMPGLDGFQATAEIRTHEASSSRTPIIAMTAEAMERDRRRCLEAGMDDYLSKPVSFESLAAALGRWVPLDGQPPVTSITREGSSAESRVEEEAPMLDPAVIADLRKLESRRGKEWMSGLIATYLAGAETTLEELRRAVDEEDAQLIDDLTHALTGSVATFGARGLGDLCRRLKAMVSQGHLEAARETLAAIEAELARVRAALRTEFPAWKETAR